MPLPHGGSGSRATTRSTSFPAFHRWRWWRDQRLVSEWRSRQLRQSRLFVPADLSRRQGPFFTRAECGAVYRDEAYVYRQCAQLAAQLDAVAKGVPMPDLPPCPRVAWFPTWWGPDDELRTHA